ncbi:hypothetical protein HLB23_07640 [Nocardia uniformis]|uniref:Uncharacterized protein n=1 Tax=Nocardia uniformis TaxID=53432 RepID=A0A849C441_9NOCA|nr:hypothetical protein [Nocardia uniformis]NNH69739.1 hypothetical protein [Nocardia uniformis]
MDGSNSRADERDTGPRRLPVPLMGAAAAAGAVSLGLILIGSCGLGGSDTYVAPPPLNADLQAAPTGYSTSSGTTTPAVIIPPSPTWRVASDRPPRRTPTLPSTTARDENDESRESPTRTTRPTTSRPPRITTPRTTPPRTTTEVPTTTEFPTTTELPTTTLELPEPVPPTTELPVPPAMDDWDE